MSLEYSITPAKENIYVNLSLYNPVDSTKKIPANIDVALEKPILRKCNDYKLTILRFQCPLTSIYPPFSVKGQTFGVIIEAGSNSTIQMQTLHDIDSIMVFIDNINGLLQIAHSTIFPSISNKPPYLYYNPETLLFYFVIPDSYYTNSPPVKVYFNQTLYTYLSGFPALKMPNYANNEDWYAIRIFTLPDNGFNYVPPRWSTSGIARRMVTEYPTDFRFNQFQSVIITSNIPIRQETIPQPTQGPIINTNNPYSYISTLPILTDFRSTLERYGQQNSSIIYFPTSEFRWIDLLSNGPLDRLSFNFLWQSTDQSINQIYLSPGESASLKLYFRSIH
jgi:hypothetical protein